MLLHAARRFAGACMRLQNALLHLFFLEVGDHARQTKKNRSQGVRAKAQENPKILETVWKRVIY